MSRRCIRPCCCCAAVRTPAAATGVAVPIQNQCTRRCGFTSRQNVAKLSHNSMLADERRESPRGRGVFRLSSAPVRRRRNGSWESGLSSFYTACRAALAGGDSARILARPVKGAAVDAAGSGTVGPPSLVVQTRGCPVQLSAFTSTPGPVTPNVVSPWPSRIVQRASITPHK
jgi:hypothetical protein